MLVLVSGFCKTRWDEERRVTRSGRRWRMNMSNMNQLLMSQLNAAGGGMGMIDPNVHAQAQLLAAQIAAANGVNVFNPALLGMQGGLGGSNGMRPNRGGRSPSGARSATGSITGSGGLTNSNSNSNSKSIPGSGEKPEDEVDPALLSDIPSWFRSLRLHKYTPNFAGMNWRDIVVMDEGALEAKGVAVVGARRKMLKTFEIVRGKMGIDMNTPPPIPA